MTTAERVASLAVPLSVCVGVGASAVLATATGDGLVSVAVGTAASIGLAMVLAATAPDLDTGVVWRVAGATAAAFLVLLVAPNGGLYDRESASGVALVWLASLALGYWLFVAGGYDRIRRRLRAVVDDE